MKYRTIIVTFLVLAGLGCALSDGGKPQGKQGQSSEQDGGSRHGSGGALGSQGSKSNQKKITKPPTGPQPALGPTAIINKGGYVAKMSPRAYSVIGFFKADNTAVSRQEFISLLVQQDQAGLDFRFLVNDATATLPAPQAGNNGYMLQAPLISNATHNDPMYFVAIPSHIGANAATFADYLWNCQPRPQGSSKSMQFTQRFWQFFAFTGAFNFTSENQASITQHAYGAAVFKGGGGTGSNTEIMVSPCPADANMADPQNQPFGHIYTFARAINDPTDPVQAARLQSFWFAVGSVASYMYNNGNLRDLAGNPSPDLYLSTHGHGVAYMHFRVENQATHYGEVPDLQNAAQANAYHQAVFP